MTLSHDLLDLLDEMSETSSDTASKDGPHPKHACDFREWKADLFLAEVELESLEPTQGEQPKKIWYSQPGRRL